MNNFEGDPQWPESEDDRNSYNFESSEEVAEKIMEIIAESNSTRVFLFTAVPFEEFSYIADLLRGKGIEVVVPADN